MKKLIAVLLLSTTLLSLTALTESKHACIPKATHQEQVILTGGWERAASPVLSDELKTLFAQAFEGFTGTAYTPVAYLGSQVAAGTNHRFLCRSKAATPDVKEFYAFVYLHAPLEGKAEIKEIVETGALTHLSDERIEDGWTQVESPALTEKAQKAFDEAFAGLTGVSYEPIALLSAMAFKAINYCILCEETVVVPDTESRYVLTYISQDAEGKAAIISIEDLTVRH